MNSSQRAFQNELHTIDCRYIFPRFASSYLRIAESENAREACFIDNNTAPSVPLLLERLKHTGLTPEDVRYVIITHVHLDHSGGSSALLKACPNAKLLCHPRAARHVIDPSKLIASAQQVYGEERFRDLYGQIEAIDAKRVHEVADGEIFHLAGQELQFFHARGHANHHFCVIDPMMEAVYTGDAFGVSYPDIEGFLILPSTSPTDFDPVEARRTVQKIRDLPVRGAYLTHYGRVERLAEAADQLIEQLDFSEALLERALSRAGSDQEVLSYCENELNQFYRDYLGRLGLPQASTWKWIELDLKLNAAGIAHVALKKRRSQSPN